MHAHEACQQALLLISYSISYAKWIAGTLKKPVRGIENYRSIVAILDGRNDLYNEHDLTNSPSNSDATNYAHGQKPPDFYIMKAKLAYENDKFDQKVVTNNWNVWSFTFFNWSYV